MSINLSAHLETWFLERPFGITGQRIESIPLLVVELSDSVFTGRGEALGVPYLGETPQGMLNQVRAVENDVCQGASREDLLNLLPSGGARNALDCALWDLEAKRSGHPIWSLIGLDPHPVTTVFTIGLEETADAMAAKAAAAADYPVLKIKLDGDRPLEKLTAIRAARPDAELVVDANQGWTLDQLDVVAQGARHLDLQMIEQPLPRGQDAGLEGFHSPIPLAADESCQDTNELDYCVGRYDIINIKLDKTGGLTEALRLAEAAKLKGKKLMVGNMLGTSLAMAPAFVIAQYCDFVDIDGPLLLQYDRPGGLHYANGRVNGFVPAFWG